MDQVVVVVRVFLVDMVVTVVEKVVIIVVEEDMVLEVRENLVVLVQFVLFGQEMKDSSPQLEHLMSRIG